LTRGNVGVANEQWKALPDYLDGDKSNTLVVADVSGSMTCPAGNNKTVQCIDVCVSLALYLSERNHGLFKDSFITFSNKPELQVLKGDLMNRVQQLRNAAWQMNTNLEAVFRLILDSAQKNRLAQEDMPSNIIILSDMQFDQCVGTGTSGQYHSGYDYGKLQTRANPKAIEMIREEYKKAGYVPPVVIFWNLNNRDNVPVTMNDCGVALVSGFSPAIMKSVLGAKLDEITPEGMMHKVIDDKRYDF
jgi:hypothetical protein